MTDNLEIPFWKKYIWNFRDLSNFNPNIKEGRFFRSACLVGVQDKFNLLSFFEEYNIGVILDLRSKIEVKSEIYKSEILKKIYYKNIPFNPFKASGRFNKVYNNLSPGEIAYHYFIKKYKSQIKRVFEYIAEKSDSNILIHCVAGKDRTGIIATLLHLLSGQSAEDAKTDYLATVLNINEKCIDIVFDEINQYQGIENYLLSCKINISTLKIIRDKFFI